jgi:hypothetical protein
VLQEQSSSFSSTPVSLHGSLLKFEKGRKGCDFMIMGVSLLIVDDVDVDVVKVFPEFF